MEDGVSTIPATADTIAADDVATIPALFAERVRRTPDRAAYRQFDSADKCWHTYTWRDMADRVALWRGGFAASGFTFGDRVAILTGNSVEWVCFDQAALSLGLVTVPLHVTDGPHNWADQLADAAPRLLLVGLAEHLRKLAPLRRQLPALERIVCLEPIPDDIAGAVHIGDWLADKPVAAVAAVQPDTLATITYTSGTTGRPKGVMLSHRNIVTAASAVLQRNPGYVEDVFLSFLPMAHIFERTTEYYLAIACGGEIAFARSIPDLPEDLATIRPSIVMGVPRIFERVWKGIVISASGNPIGRLLLERAAALGPEAGRRGLIESVQRWLIKRLVTKKVLRRFGGRLRTTVCGGAPLSADLARALRAIGLPLVEGYGLAEAAGPVSGDNVADYEPGSVGRPLDGMDVRLSETGEILLRSSSVMAGYWNRPEETAEVLDKDGWLHTGDIGELHGGRLYVRGRVRDLIVLSTGEKLAPSDLESRIITDPLFEQAMVIGDRRSIVAALVVLDKSRWTDFAGAKGLNPENPNDPDSERALRQQIGELCRRFPEYAQIRRLHAGFDPWTTESGLLSVTLKVKRNAVAAAFCDEINQLFESHERLTGRGSPATDNGN